MAFPLVSVIIPAHNAARTLAETVRSLQAQSFSGWEAIIINDGSCDETATVAAQIAAEDNRIKVINQAQNGVCVARNNGIGQAQAEWLLFLDADDWISPDYLLRMTQAIAATPALDVVHCGWVRVAPDGTRLGEKYGPAEQDLFPVLANYCPFAMHACIARKSIVQEVGAFDSTLVTCEDWDLWLRIARVGGRFGAVRELLAFYRMTPNSLSSDGIQFFSDALRVINQGHSPDTRVTHPLPQYAAGQSKNAFSSQKLYLCSWFAGLLLGRGKDARHLLQWVKEDQDADLQPSQVAENIFETALLPTCQPPTAWHQLWPAIQACIQDFLLALEAQSQAAGLAHRTSRILEQMILQHTRSTDPITIGATHGILVEVTRPITDIATPPMTEILFCRVEIENASLGFLELPVQDGIVAAKTITDAIADRFAWQILGKFFEYTLYGAEGINAHERIGWVVFLQQLWGKPEWPNDYFYNPHTKEKSTLHRLPDTQSLTIEVSEELTSYQVKGSHLDVRFTVGGAATGSVTVPVIGKVVTAQAIRAAVTLAGGLELCKACVREGLIGKPLNNGRSLRYRLQQAANGRTTYC